MTKRKRTNQKKTHPKLYQNKRSLAGSVVNALVYDTIFLP